MGQQIRRYTPYEAEAAASRLERKADRREEWADGRAAKATASFDRARELGDMIPMGQPILVGHHSEGRHRRHLAKIDRAGAQGVEHADMRDHHQGKANRQRAAAAEIRRRAHGPRYGQHTGLRKGDRIADTGSAAAAGLMTAVVVRANKKSVTVQACHACTPDTPIDQIRWIWPYANADTWATKYPARVDWLKVQQAWTLDADGTAVEVYGDHDGEGNPPPGD